MHRSTLWKLCALALAAGASSCGQGEVSSRRPPAGAGRLHVQLDGALLATSGVARVALTVGPGSGEPRFEPLSAELAATGDAWTGFVSGIPAGPRRDLEVVAYDAAGGPLFRGGAVADVPADAVRTVVILVQRVGAGGATVSSPVVSVGLSAAAVAPGGTAQLRAMVASGDRDLAYAWAATCGTFDAQAAPETRWTAPTLPNQRCQLSLTASSSVASTTVELAVDVLADPSSRSVFGRRQLTCWADPAAGSSIPTITTTGAPDVSTLAPPAALVPTAPGAWASLPGGQVGPDGTFLPGAFAADGAFYIPGLPRAGSYLLSFRDAAGVQLLLETTSGSVDLGQDVLGRCPRIPASPGTATTFQLGNLDAWAADASELWLGSSADVWTPLAGGPALPGGATSAALLVPWSGPRLAPSDVIWIEQLSPRLHESGFTYRAATRAARVAQGNLVDGGTNTLATELQEPARAGALAVSWAPAAFERALADMAPASRVAPGRVPAHRLAVTATPFGGGFPSPDPSGSLPLATLDLPAGAVAVGLASPLTYGRFLPPSWSEWREVRYAVAVGYGAPGASDLHYALSWVGQREALPAPAGTLAPLLTPIRSPRLNGAPAMADATGPVTETPTFSWSPPSTGTPSAYALELYALGADAGGHSTARLAARYLTRSTSATLPPGVLAAGTTYFARIAALASDVPYLSAPLRHAPVLAEATALTGTFTP